MYKIIFMKTQITLTIDSDIKNKLQKVAKNMGTNVSTLANMYFIKVINTWKIEYYKSDEGIEFWEVSTNELTQEDLLKIKDIESRDISSFTNI